MKYGAEKSAEIFRLMGEKKSSEIAVEYKFDKVYKNLNSATQAVVRIYHDVKNDPEKFGVTDEEVVVVMKAVDDRQLFQNTGKTIIKPDTAAHDIQIKPTMMRIRDNAFTLIDRKLRLYSTNKKLEKISFKELGIVAGIAFDKARILQGEATEHIAIHSKIDDNLSPEDKMKLLLKVREVNEQKKMKN